MFAMTHLAGFGVGASGGAFPVAEASNTGTNSSVVTSHSVPLPASIAAGELLVVLFALAVNTTVDTPSGWTKLLDQSNASNPRYHAVVFYKIADGTEGSTLTVTLSGTGARGAYNSWRFSGAGTPTLTNSAQTNTTSFDPPSHSPGSTAKYLWLAGMMIGRPQTLNSHPSGYSGGIEAVGTINNNGHAQAASAWKTNEASSEDPGGFSMAAAAADSGGQIVTISIPPA